MKTVELNMENKQKLTQDVLHVCMKAALVFACFCDL